MAEPAALPEHPPFVQPIAMPGSPPDPHESAGVTIPGSGTDDALVRSNEELCRAIEELRHDLAAQRRDVGAAASGGGASGGQSRPSAAQSSQRQSQVEGSVVGSRAVPSARDAHAEGGASPWLAAIGRTFGGG